MAVAYRSVATTTLASRTNITITKPSGTVDNDILLAGIHVEGDAAVTPPSGWALVTTVDETTVDIDYYIYWKRASSEGADYTWTFAANWSAGVIVAVSGAITSGDPQDATVGTDNDDGAITTVNIPSVTTATDGSLAVAFTTEYNTAITATTPSGWDERADVDGSKVWTKTQTTAGATGATTSTLSSASYKCTAVVAIKVAPAYTTDQEGFRFGEDDGNEAAHTFTAAQDTNITTAADTAKLLRTLINTTLDTPSTAYTLRSQKNGSGGYVAVPLTATTVTRPVIETADCTISGNNTAQATWAVSHPAAATGDLLIFYIAWDDSTATTDVAEPSGVNGETLTEINATPITDSSTETRAKAWYCKCTGAWTATTITFTPTATESWSATVIKVLAGEFDATTPIGTTATRTTTVVTDTAALSPAMTAGASDGGGALLWFAGVDTDPLTGTITGWSILQQQDLGAVAHGCAVRTATVTDSESIAGGDTWTIAGDSWTSIGIIVRGVVVTNDVYVIASANIAAGGEATTARLTAPATKTTSDFTTGRRWDNENGTDSIDIVTDDYTEVEWSLKLRSGLSAADYFDFRTYAGSTALDTYTLTPRWTIGGSSRPPFRKHTLYIWRKR